MMEYARTPEAEEQDIRAAFLLLMIHELPAAAERSQQILPPCPQCGAPYLVPLPCFRLGGISYTCASDAPVTCGWFGSAAELPPFKIGEMWPVLREEDFGRIMLDAAVRGPWWETTETPAYRTLPLRTIARAVAIGREMLNDGAQACIRYEQYSRALREKQTAPLIGRRSCSVRGVKGGIAQ